MNNEVKFPSEIPIIDTPWRRCLRPSSRLCSRLDRSLLTEQLIPGEFATARGCTNRQPPTDY